MEQVRKIGLFWVVALFAIPGLSCPPTPAPWDIDDPVDFPIEAYLANVATSGEATEASTAFTVKVKNGDDETLNSQDGTSNQCTYVLLPKQVDMNISLRIRCLGNELPNKAGIAKVLQKVKDRTVIVQSGSFKKVTYGVCHPTRLQWRDRWIAPTKFTSERSLRFFRKDSRMGKQKPISSLNTPRSSNFDAEIIYEQRHAR